MSDREDEVRSMYRWLQEELQAHAVTDAHEVAFLCVCMLNEVCARYVHSCTRCALYGGFGAYMEDGHHDDGCALIVQGARDALDDATALRTIARDIVDEWEPASSEQPKPMLRPLMMILHGCAEVLRERMLSASMHLQGPCPGCLLDMDHTASRRGHNDARCAQTSGFVST